MLREWVQMHWLRCGGGNNSSIRGNGAFSGLVGTECAAALRISSGWRCCRASVPPCMIQYLFDVNCQWRLRPPSRRDHHLRDSNLIKSTSSRAVSSETSSANQLDVVRFANYGARAGATPVSQKASIARYDWPSSWASGEQEAMLYFDSGTPMDSEQLTQREWRGKPGCTYAMKRVFHSTRSFPSYCF